MNQKTLKNILDAHGLTLHATRHAGSGHEVTLKRRGRPVIYGQGKSLRGAIECAVAEVE